LIRVVDSIQTNSLGERVLGGFTFSSRNPNILLFKGADVSIFVHEFVNFRQAAKAGIKDIESFGIWRDANRAFLEDQVQIVLSQLGY
jgi:hypothetical protein